MVDILFMNANDPIGPTPDINPNEEWPEAYDCFADPKFLSMLPGLLVRNEAKFRKRRHSLRMAEKFSELGWQQRVGSAA